MSPASTGSTAEIHHGFQAHSHGYDSRLGRYFLVPPRFVVGQDAFWVIVESLLATGAADVVGLTRVLDLDGNLQPLRERKSDEQRITVGADGHGVTR